MVINPMGLYFFFFLQESERDVPSWLSAITPAEEALDLNVRFSVFQEELCLMLDNYVSEHLILHKDHWTLEIV